MQLYYRGVRYQGSNPISKQHKGKLLAFIAVCLGADSTLKTRSYRKQLPDSSIVEQIQDLRNCHTRCALRYALRAYR